MKTATRITITFNQGTWWKTRDGLIHLIADLEPRHRANIAGWLINRAASYHLRARRRWYLWDMWVGGSGYDGDAGDPMDNFFLRLDEDPGYVDRLIRREQDRGEHLDWMRNTVLFQAVIAGIEDQLGPGVL